MKCTIRIANFNLFIDSEFDMKISKELYNFIINNDFKDVNIKIKDSKYMLHPQSKRIGEDMMMYYYIENGKFYSEGIPAKLNSILIVESDLIFENIMVGINYEDFPKGITLLDKIIQLLPMKQILIRHHAFMLHSSQISIENKGLLFTAPSGTGKSTQANLWKVYKNVDIACNDRTLLCNENNEWYTYGYPIDGSDPVCSPKSNKLGAIVILRQGKNNEIIKPRIAQALKLLMEQTIADFWDTKMMECIQNYWINILSHYPIYIYYCLPDSSAVDVLEEQLRKDGVLRG